MWGKGMFFRMRSRVHTPAAISYHPADFRKSVPALARSLIQGKVCLQNGHVHCTGGSVLLREAVPETGRLHAWLHDFSWLVHFNTLADKEKETARILVRSWIEHYGHRSGEMRDPALTAKRLFALCAHYSLLTQGSGMLCPRYLLKSMGLHVRYLVRTLDGMPSGTAKLCTALYLGIAGYSLSGCESAGEQGLKTAERELERSFCADGGCISRNPSCQIMLALLLMYLVEAVSRSTGFTPAFLRHTGLRAAGTALFFCCGDGHPVVFNGSYEDSISCPVQLLKKMTGTLPAPAEFVPGSGYQRLSARQSLLIADTGSCDRDEPGFESAGSVHFSSGKGRVFVNCGNGNRCADKWADALYRKEAHSALAFDSEIPAVFRSSACFRAEEEHGSLLEIKFRVDFVNIFSIPYTRRLFLSSDGSSLRGEECFDLSGKQDPGRVVIRFHLHPSVHASMSRGGRSVVMLLSNGEGWRFRATGMKMVLEKSVYCGYDGSVEGSGQIVLSGSLCGPGRTGSVRWALARMEPA